jgi:hypothetical protein
MRVEIAHGHHDGYWGADERLRFSLTVAGISGCLAVGLQLLLLGASTLIRDAIPFLLGGQVPLASRFVLKSGSAPLFIAAVIAVDAVVFWAMFRLATRKGAGMMLVPVLFYLMTSVIIGWLAVMPVCLAITQSK